MPQAIDPAQFVRDDADEIITAPPSPPPARAESASTIGGRRSPKVSRPSSLNRELLKDSIYFASQVVAGPADDDASPPTSPTSLWERLGVEITTESSRPGTPTLIRGPAISQTVQRDAAAVRAAFKNRVQAKVGDSVNISPNDRESFERMLWTLMIVGANWAPAGYKEALFPAQAIPVIQQVPNYMYNVVKSAETQLLLDNLDLFLSHTEALLRHYPLPSRVTANLAKIARGINNSIFARYMGSRGTWSLNRCFGAVLILLRWWAATAPAFMMEYRTAISMNAKDTFLCDNLRGELRDVLNINVNDGKGLELAITKGFNEIASYRREMHVAISGMFEAMVDAARGGVDGNSSTSLVE